MTVGTFFKRYWVIRSLLVEMGFSQQRVEAAMLLLKMFLYYRGPVTPSTLWVAEMSGCSEKTVDRMVAWLRSEGLISTQRLRRYELNGGQRRGRDLYYSVNKISLEGLAKVVAKLLRPALKYDRANLKVQIQRLSNLVSIKGWFPGATVPPWEEWFEFKRLLTGTTRLPINLRNTSLETWMRLIESGFGISEAGNLVRSRSGDLVRPRG